MLERYYKLANLSREQDRFLFRGLVTTKKGSRLRSNGGLSYTRARKDVLDMLAAIGLDKKQFGLHSQRSDGASAAANAGALFKRHGRWKSENAKDGYIKYSLEESLKVSHTLSSSTVAVLV